MTKEHSTLTKSERTTLSRCESVIDRANRYDLERTKALRTIRDSRLYRETHKTFESYCTERWNLSRQHAARLINHAEIVHNLSPFGDVPKRESHARPLRRLTEVQQRRAWKLYLGTKPTRHTAAAIAGAAQAVKMSPVNSSIEDLTVPTPNISTPLRWYGAKTKLAAQIVATFPPHRTFIEPFCGSAAVLFAKTPSHVEIINDRHAELVAFFRVLRDKPKELQRLVSLTPYAKDEHRFCTQNPTGDDDLETARRFFVRCRQTYGGRLDDTWSFSFKQNCAVWHKSAADEMLGVAERFRTVQIENVDFRTLLRRTPDRADILMYLDPPYLPEVRTANKAYDVSVQ